MSHLAKKKYRVETTGVIRSEIYTANDPDDAVRLAKRAETFFRMVVANPKMSGEEAIKKVDESIDKNWTLPEFNIRKITEVRTETK